MNEPSKCECCGRFASIRIRHPREEKPDIFLCDNCIQTHNRAFEYGSEWGKVERVTSWKGRELKEQAMTERKESCGECRYFQKFTHSSDGMCRRNPPAVGVNDDGDQMFSVFPFVFNISWCGEYRPKAEGAEERR